MSARGGIAGTDGGSAHLVKVAERHQAAIRVLGEACGEAFAQPQPDHADTETASHHHALEDSRPSAAARIASRPWAAAGSLRRDRMASIRRRSSAVSTESCIASRGLALSNPTIRTRAGLA